MGIVKPKTLTLSSVVYRILHPIAHLLSILVFRLKVVGVENVPKDEGAIVCANHSSYLDPVILGTALPREAYHMAKDGLFKNPLFARIITLLNAFPIKREGFSRQAFKRVMDLLKKGELVIIYPEGTRSPDGEIRRPRLGVGMIVSLAMDVLVVPARIIGTHRALPVGGLMIRPWRIEVRFGRPIHFKAPSNPTREDYRSIAETIMSKIMEL